MPTPKKPNLDSVTTINDDGSRYFLHPADVKGRWVIARRLLGAVLIAIYGLLPCVPINGNPAVFLDVENRMFHLFGATLVPQDLWVMFFFISGLGFTLFAATALLGRVWCGWACPYTVFLDHLYRRIERGIEGDAPARRALDQSPWTVKKIVKRAMKHVSFMAISAAIAHGFLSYFISWKRLDGFMHEGPLPHATAFACVAILTLVLWFCFGYFREQFCIILCPYGRLQGALIDDDTLNVGYDAIRGEPRGVKGTTQGDCIDCHRCVQVCPTGIDIRNGLQLECIACTSCIDACNDVMTKIKRPHGLIRYDSFNGFTGKVARFLRPRVYAYAFLAVLGLGALAVVALHKARSFNATISRAVGPAFYSDAQSIRNIYQIRVFNKHNQDATVSIRLGEGTPPGYQLGVGGQTFPIAALSEVSLTCVVIAPIDAYTGMTDMALEIRANPGNVTLEKIVRFIGPNPQLLRHPRTGNP
jgi:cytochrome c oxidase accessory protein FixG